MRVEWYGQSAFRLSSPEASVAIDPFGDLSRLASRGLQFDYPTIEGVQATPLLVTHEHADHNGVEVVGGDPTILRSTAGRLESPIGQVTAIASEHDEDAGTTRGPNTIFVFELDRLRVSHFGDFGQRALRDEQAAAIGSVDLLFIPVGSRQSATSRRQRSSSATLAVGRPDALAHSAHRLPRDRRRVPRALRQRGAPARGGVRHRRTGSERLPAGRSPRGAVRTAPLLSRCAPNSRHRAGRKR
jgi:L-ascorbate metabolism protein UlaG (beta-lactamase superfamily)